MVQRFKGLEVDKRWTNEVLEYWVSGVRCQEREALGLEP